ncbi:sugar transferase [Desulfosporosinus nitroreducens]|uniref:sugar transferase n=1 Tax=Desulfosporosinus nitroreducens TaxID=2018668 RepID=UPI00207C39A2|nr:sugar transferase [Desulfosporosinus nitroreducens]MCO1600977.1 sugar transferase [Desulfosporosinus nitroreducens]
MNMRASEVLQKEAQVQFEERKFPGWKRMIDIIGALVGLILFSPIIVVVSFIIYVTDGRPIFFSQDRLGLGGETFHIYKFRSMRRDAEEVLRGNPVIYNKYVSNNYKLPEGQDPRITKIGFFLRKTSLDELPQFWNVLIGNMSLVGPRPIVQAELNEYGSKRFLFLNMKPGITGVWQVSGRSDLKYPERVDVELSYLEKQGMTFDIAVLFRTVYCVFKRKGAL